MKIQPLSFSSAILGLILVATGAPSLYSNTAHKLPIATPDCGRFPFHRAVTRLSSGKRIGRAVARKLRAATVTPRRARRTGIAYSSRIQDVVTHIISLQASSSQVKQVSSSDVLARLVHPAALSRSVRSPTPTGRGGLSLEKCSDSAPCEQTRTCATSATGPLLTCDGRAECVCVPIPYNCTLDSDCLVGEECAYVPPIDKPICASSDDIMSSKYSDGLTASLCHDDSDCRDSRSCQYSGEPCSQEDDFCLCVPKTFYVCADIGDCSDGEVCKVLSEKTYPYCVTPNLASISPVASNSSATSSSDDNGLTGSRCSKDSDCRGDRTCGTSADPCTANENCFCFPETLVQCMESKDCAEGETCQITGKDKSPICVSSIDAPEASVTLNRPSTTAPPPTSESPATTPFASASMNEFASITEPLTSRSPPGDGLSISLCNVDADCFGSRLCKKANSSCPPDASQGCVCMPEGHWGCKHSGDCSDGEVCKDAGLRLGTKCMSPDALPNTPSIPELTPAPRE